MAEQSRAKIQPRASPRQRKPGTARTPLPAARLTEHTAVTGDARPGQAARLTDPGVQTAQRHAVVARIGRAQGNQYVSRVIASMQEAPALAHAGADRADAGTLPGSVPVTEHGTGSPQELAPSLSRPDGLRASGLDACTAGSAAARSPANVVQRGLIDAAREAARGALNRLFGQADAGRSGIQQAGSEGGTQLATTAGAQEQSLQGDAEAQGVQAQAEADAERDQLQAQADAQGAQLQGQAGAVETELQAQADAEHGLTMENEAEFEAMLQTKRVDLEGQATSTAGHLRAGSSAGEAEISAREGALAQESGTLQQGVVEQARQPGDSATGPSQAQQVFGTSMGEIARGVSALPGMLQGVGERILRQLGRRTSPVQQGVQRLVGWVRQRVQNLWNRIFQGQSHVARFVRGAMQRLLGFQQRVRDTLQRLIGGAVNRIRQRILQRVQRVRSLASRVQNFVRRVKDAVVARLRQRAGRIFSRLQELAGPVVRFFAGAVRRALGRVRSFVAPVLSRLRSRAMTVLDRVRAFGRRAWSGLQRVGSRLFTLVRRVGTRLRRSLQRAAEAVLRGIRVAARGARRLLDRLREQLGSPLQRLWDQVRSLGTRFRERYLQPAIDWVRSRVTRRRQQAISFLRRIWQGWLRLGRRLGLSQGGAETPAGGTQGPGTAQVPGTAPGTAQIGGAAGGVHVGPEGVEISAPVVQINAPIVQVNAPLTSASGVVKTPTLVADSVVSTTYTPGAGNVQ